MNHIVKVNSDGKIVVPDDISKTLGVAPGDEVEFVRNETGRFELWPKSETLADLAGVLKLERPVSDDEIDSWISEARGAMASGSAK